MRRDAVQIEGVVAEALSNGTYRVELPNGHRLLAFVPQRLREQAARLEPGRTVWVEVSPCDMSVGRLSGWKE